MNIYCCYRQLNIFEINTRIILLESNFIVLIISIKKSEGVARHAFGTKSLSHAGLA